MPVRIGKRAASKLCNDKRRRREQYNANQKYTAAVTVMGGGVRGRHGADGYICTQALHWKTKEGLVRMCAPRDGGSRTCRACRAG